MIDRLGVSRTARVALLAVAAALLACGLSLWTPWSLFEARLLDYASTLAPPALPAPAAEAPVVIVAIDEPSFADLGLQWPWPRSVHGELAAALRKAGAKAVGFDVLFAERSAPEEDARLAEALGPHDVLAADETLIETPHMTQLSRIEPPPELLSNGAKLGIVSIVLDGDGVLRRLPPDADAFADTLLAAAGIEAAPRRSALAQALGSGERYIQMAGPARTYPTVSYYQALEPDLLLPPDTFRDKIVIVGFSLQSAPDASTGGTDAFATAFTTWTGRLVPGAGDPRDDPRQPPPRPLDREGLAARSVRWRSA